MTLPEPRLETPRLILRPPREEWRRRRAAA
jgi:hypothetical protein